MSNYKPKLVHLPNTTLTPEVVLHRTLNKLARIKAVALVIQWDDDTFDSDWSQMKVSDFCMAAQIMMKNADLQIDAAGVRVPIGMDPDPS